MRNKNTTKIIMGLILMMFCASFFYFQFAPTSKAAKNQELHDYWANQNNVVIAGYGYYYVYANLFPYDSIYGLIETSGTSDAINFFICDSTNFDLYDNGFTASVQHLRTDVHIAYVEYTIPYSDTWYFVFENDGLFSVTLDFFLDLNGNDSPWYDPSLWDLAANYESLEPGYLHWYSLGDLGKGDIITGEYATMFTSDGIDMYILDEVNKDRYLAALSIETLYHVDGYYHTTFGPVKIPEKGEYFILFTARDETDTVTFSFGVDIEEGFPIIPVIIGASVGMVALAIIVPVSVVASRKKKARLQDPMTSPSTTTSTTTTTYGQQQPSGDTQAPVSEVLGKKFCDNCGFKLPLGVVFCPACGKSLK